MCLTHKYLVTFSYGLVFLFYYLSLCSSLAISDSKSCSYCHLSCFIITYHKFQLLLVYLYGMLHHQQISQYSRCLEEVVDRLKTLKRMWFLIWILEVALI